MWKFILVIAVLIQNATCQSRQDPCKLKSGLTSHESYCDKYYICRDGSAEEENCPDGLAYVGPGRGLVAPCDYDFKIDCSDRPNRNPARPTTHCDRLYGIFGHETSCTRYWACWNGSATEQFCVGGLLYNEETHGCDWPQNVDGCQKHPLCKDDPNANVPLGKSCTRYWQCQGGYPRLMRCPAVLVFDKNIRSCVLPPTEDCEIPTTLLPPVEDEEEKSEESNELRYNNYGNYLISFDCPIRGQSSSNQVASQSRSPFLVSNSHLFDQ